MQQWRGIDLDPEDYGWERVDDKLIPKQGIKELCSQELLTVVQCKCKKGCRTNSCSCKKSGSSCSIRCDCIDCQNRDDEDMGIQSDDESEDEDDIDSGSETEE